MHLKDEIIKETNRVEIVQTLFRRLESSRGLQDLLGREKDAIRTQQAARMLELEKKLAEYREKYGVFPGGEKAAREILLSKKSGANEKISQTVRTILETKATPEEMVPDIMELAMEGKYSCEEASREVVADAMADILPDSHFVENLYQKNQNLFERVLNKLKEFVKNVREYFAHVNPNTKLEAAVLKENTESGMRYLEKIVEAFDKTAEAATENYQQGTTESTAESKTQYKTRGKYWRPDLKGSEWRLLERRMAEEIGSRENYLDDATKWVYANEKGVQVFALYGVGDGTDATPLYAVGGKRAAALKTDITDYVEGRKDADRNGQSADSWVEQFQSKKRSRGRNLSEAQEQTGTAGTADELYGGQQERNAGGTAERGPEDQRGVKEKFSLRDSTGRELTEAQQAYFKDSKVRDADGNLKPVYHGSAAIFTKFSADFMSQNGSSEGQGFYFTDYKPMAQGYEKNGGQLLEGYLDIKKPLSDSEVTLTAAEVKRLIRAVDPTGDDLVLNYDSRGGMGYPSRAWYNRSVEDTLRATMSTSDSDSEILAELANGMGDPGKVLKTVRELLGYDGYIVEGKYDNATVYVAFDSSQFKNADNKTPTADPDIRYSLRENFPNEIDSWAEDSMPEGVRFTLGSTGPVLQGLGAIESDIYMEGDKIKKILQDHPEMTLAEIKKVPQILEDPALVLKSKTRTNSLVVLGTYRAQNGKPILAAMDLLPRGKGFVVNGLQKVASAYTKTGSQTATAEQVGRKFLMGSDVLFADKKRTAVVLRPMGISAPIDLLRNGYIGSISYKKGFVNIQGVPFSSVVKTVENTGNDRHALRDVAMSDRDVLRRAADLALSDRKMNFTQADRERLKIFKKRLDILDEKQTQRQGYLQAKRDILSNSARLF